MHQARDVGELLLRVIRAEAARVLEELEAPLEPMQSLAVFSEAVYLLFKSRIFGRHLQDDDAPREEQRPESPGSRTVSREDCTGSAPLLEEVGNHLLMALAHRPRAHELGVELAEMLLAQRRDHQRERC